MKLRCERCLFMLPASAFRARSDTGKLRSTCKACEANATALRRGGTVQRAPCLTCGEVHPVSAMDDGTCRACLHREDQARVARWAERQARLRARIQAAGG